MSKRLEYVYILRLACTPPVYKIGMSVCPESRLKQFLGWMPWPVSLVHRIKTDRAADVEAVLHERFEHRYLSHEWFQLSDDELGRLTALTECSGPSDLPAEVGNLNNGHHSRRHRERPRRSSKPIEYDPEKYLNPKRNPWLFAVTKDPAVLIAVGERARCLRRLQGKTQTQIGNFGLSYQITYDDPPVSRKERICPSWLTGAECGQKIVTRGQLLIWSFALGMTPRQFLGDDLGHLLPHDWLDKPVPDMEKLRAKWRLQREERLREIHRLADQRKNAATS